MAYCTREDVTDLLQEASLTGALGQRPAIIDTAIKAQTQRIRNATGRHWYDPGSTTLLDDSVVTATEMRYDVPSSPHAPGRMLAHHDTDTRYPVTSDGRYVRITLDHADVQSISKLLIRDAAGNYDDWTTLAGKTQGRGEDYFISTPSDGGAAGYTRLYLDAGALPSVTDHAGMVVLDYDYGTSGVPETVRRMAALYAAAELVVEDEFVTSIPDDGQLTNVESKAERWTNTADEYLEQYRRPIA